MKKTAALLLFLSLCASVAWVLLLRRWGIGGLAVLPLALTEPKRKDHRPRNKNLFRWNLAHDGEIDYSSRYRNSGKDTN